MRKVLLLFLAAVFCAGLFAACGPDGADTSLPSSQGGTQTVSEDVSGPSDTDSSAADTSGNAPTSSHRYVGMTDQKNRRIVVFDLAAKDWSKKTAVVWSFSDPTCRTAAGIKFRHSDL